MDSKEIVTTSTAAPSSGGWWSFLDKVKQQTETIVNIYKEDLKEFSNTITKDTKEAIKAPEIKSKLGLGLFGSSQTEKAKNPSTVDRYQAKVSLLESELSTYSTDSPDNGEFLAWKKQFNLQSKTDEISRILADKEKVRDAHSKLVPLTVSYADFWERYYYKMHKLNDENVRRARLVEWATNSAQSEEEQFSWDEEEEKEEKEEPAKEVHYSASKPEEVEEYFQKLDEKEEQEPVVQKNQEEAQQKSDEDWVVVKETKNQLSDQTVNEQPIQKEEKPKAESGAPKEEGWDDWE